jgi:hypothetical protein
MISIVRNYRRNKYQIPGKISIINFRMTKKPRINADKEQGLTTADQKNVVFKITISKEAL